MALVTGRAKFSSVDRVRPHNISRMVILIISGIHCFFKRASEVGNASIGCCIVACLLLLKFKTLLLMVSLNTLVKLLFLLSYSFFF